MLFHFSFFPLLATCGGFNSACRQKPGPVYLDTRRSWWQTLNLRPHKRLTTCVFLDAPLLMNSRTLGRWEEEAETQFLRCNDEVSAWYKDVNAVDGAEATLRLLLWNIHSPVCIEKVLAGPPKCWWSVLQEMHSRTRRHWLLVLKMLINNSLCYFFILSCLWR